MKRQPIGPCKEHAERPEFGCERCINYVRYLQREAEKQDELEDAPTRHIQIEWSGTVSLSGTVMYEAQVPAKWSEDDVWEVYESELYDLVNEACDEALTDALGEFVNWNADSTIIGPVIAPRSPRPPDGQPELSA